MNIEQILNQRFPTKGFCSDYTQLVIERINAFEVFGHYEDWSCYYSIRWGEKLENHVEAETLSAAINKMIEIMDKPPLPENNNE